MTGLQVEVQEMVLQQQGAESLIAQGIKALETCRVINIVCNRGKHRSVAIAELIKQRLTTPRKAPVPGVLRR